MKSLLILLLAVPAYCAQITDDRDISAPFYPEILSSQLASEGRLENGALVFQAEQLSKHSGAPSAPVFGTLKISDPKGREFPARFASVYLIGANGLAAAGETNEKGEWALQPASNLSGAYTLHFRFENRFWKFQDKSGRAYEWQGPAVVLPAGGDTGVWRLDPESANGQAGFMQQTFIDAVEFFERNKINTSWWKKTVKVIWPGDSDYFLSYNWSINLTNAKAWDVNLHEMGHSIVAAATQSRSGGGQHKIDECYSTALAWSEGFPTFFAGMVHLDLADPDAKFEYLVPRRAPIRIENVPGDVCKGEKNEWRVASALWDLADTNQDGEDKIAISFSRIWNSVRSDEISGFGDAWKLIKRNLTAEEIPLAQAAIAQNTISVGALTIARPLTPRMMQVNWDGTAR